LTVAIKTTEAAATATAALARARATGSLREARVARHHLHASTIPAARATQNRKVVIDSSFV